MQACFPNPSLLLGFASFAVVLDYALTLGLSAHISIIDTTQRSDYNAVWHLPSLTFLCPDLSHFDHGYVACGIVKGDGYRAAPTSELLALDVPRKYRWQTEGERALSHPITAPEITIARSIGELYGPAFALPVAMAMLTLGKRDDAFFRNGVPNEGLVLQGLTGLELPKETYGRVSLLQNVAIHGTWLDVEQMDLLLKELVE